MNTLTEEPIIIVNGNTLTKAQAMTVRVALSHFSGSLTERGLGEDIHGQEMTKLYLRRINEIEDSIALR